MNYREHGCVQVPDAPDQSASGVPRTLDLGDETPRPSAVRRRTCAGPWASWEVGVASRSYVWFVSADPAPKTLCAHPVTDVTVSAPHRLRSNALGWVKAKDPDLLAVKRSVRAAAVMPSVFGLAHLLSANPQISLLGAFGSISLLLLVDFPGRPRTRLLSYVVLFLVGSCFVALGTVVSTDKVAAVAAMAVLAFVVLFAGVVSPQAATASTAALLLFVLPVAVAEPAAAVGPRLVGWGLAGAFCIPACMLIWPTPWHDDLRRRLSATLSAVSHLAAAHAGARGDGDARAAVESELSQLRDQFALTPYPPTGSAPGAVALAKLVGRVEWIAGSAALARDAATALELEPVRAMLSTVADTLHLSASLVCDGNAHPVDDPSLVQAVQHSIERLDRVVNSVLDAEVSTHIGLGAGAPVAAAESEAGAETKSPEDWITTTLDPSFDARMLGIATALVADAALEAAGAQPVTDQMLGAVGEESSRAYWGRLASHLSFRSVWFRNAVRGAVGLALAVAIVEITDVEDGFWVVLGTLSVLRSNALGTGSSALRAVGGTAVGVVVGSAVMIGVAGHSALLWALLPIAVLVSGMAPTMLSFAAGQAGFTVLVVILFNIIVPVGWKVGLTRIEDVAMGCAVSVVVGLLFWPRGATGALGRALSEAFVTNSGFLADAVDRLTVMTRHVDTGPGERSAHSAYLRLDDAFRQFLAERGAKVVPIKTVADLFTGANRIRLAAFTLATLPVHPVEAGQHELESVAIAGAVLRDSYAASHRWYQEFGEILDNRRQSLDPPPVNDGTMHNVLRGAVDDASARRRGDQLRATLQMLWADQILETQRQVQTELASAADLFSHRRGRSILT